jgi:integrase
VLCFVLAGSHDRLRRVRLRCICSFARCLSWTRKWSESYRTRIENLDWGSRVIFVPDSKTPEGRRLVPMSRRVFELLRARCGTRTEGWVFPSKRATSGHLCSVDRLFRKARRQSRASERTGPYIVPGLTTAPGVLMRTGNLAAVMRKMGIGT